MQKGHTSNFPVNLTVSLVESKIEEN
uniref:Uncharacterized protein n=1 Tax=Arundo donax TaxID=35708 RepID=A0A0A8YGP4_ARUDO